MGRTSVALKRPGEPMLAKRIPSGRGQAEQLIPLIGALMEEANLPFASLGRVAVCIGPGGFSGIRTGVRRSPRIGLAGAHPVCRRDELQDHGGGVRGDGKRSEDLRARRSGWNERGLLPDHRSRAAQPPTRSASPASAVAKSWPSPAPPSPAGRCRAEEASRARASAGIYLHAEGRRISPPTWIPSAMRPRLITSATPMRGRKRTMLSHLKPIKSPAACITEATAADAGSLAALCAEALPPGWLVNELAKACSDPSRAVLKATEGSYLHGFLVLQFAADEAELLAIATAKDWRRRGLCSIFASKGHKRLPGPKHVLHLSGSGGE